MKFLQQFIARLGFVSKKPPEATRAATPAGTPRVFKGADGKTELYVYGEIMDAGVLDMFGDPDGFVSSAGFAQALEANQVDRVVINCIGGDVGEGIAIANKLRAAKLPVVIEGYACSMGSVIAAAAPHVTMLPGSMYMIHAPATMAYGDATAMRAMADSLDVHARAMTDIYALRIKDRSQIAKLMDAPDRDIGTWLSASEAKALGLADETPETEASTDTGQGRRKAATLEAITARYGEPPNSTQPHVTTVLRALGGSQVPALGDQSRNVPSSRVSGKGGAFRVS